MTLEDTVSHVFTAPPAKLVSLHVIKLGQRKLAGALLPGDNEGARGDPGLDSS